MTLKIQTIIENKLQILKPQYLTVYNESDQHSVPPNSETHFKVVVVSDEFIDMRAVKRHQTIYGLLANELSNGVHALALHCYTANEWKGEYPDSPVCLGAGK